MSPDSDEDVDDLVRAPAAHRVRGGSPDASR
jgi:hypothetical protein